jgi:hypothetical protein
MPRNTSFFRERGFAASVAEAFMAAPSRAEGASRVSALGAASAFIEGIGDTVLLAEAEKERASPSGAVERSLAASRSGRSFKRVFDFPIAMMSILNDLDHILNRTVQFA